MSTKVILIALLLSTLGQRLTAGLLQADGRAPEDLRFVFDISSDTGPIPESAKAEWRKRILATPDFSNRVFDLLWECVDLHASEEIGEALEALGVKADLEPGKLEKITARMWQLTNREFDQLELDEQAFLYGGAAMLGGFPSEEHEDLAIKILETGYWGAKRSAVVTLGKIGSKRSLKAVRKFATEESKRAEFARMEELEELGENATKTIKKPAAIVALEQLERRIKTAERGGAKDSSSPSSSGTRGGDGSESPMNIGILRNPSFIALWIAGAAVIGSLVWYFRTARRN